MTIQATCPDCASEYSVPDKQAGKKARCKCGSSFSIPQAFKEESTSGPRESLAESKTKRVQIPCPGCSRMLVGREQQEGKKVRCSCGNTFVFSSTQVVSANKELPPAMHDAFLNAIDLAQEKFGSAPSELSQPLQSNVATAAKNRSSGDLAYLWSYPTNVIVMATAAAIALFIVLVLIAGPTGGVLAVLGMIGLLLGVACLASWIWIMSLAFGDGELIWAIGILLIPVLAFVYGILNFHEAKIPFLVLSSSVAFSLANQILLVILSA